MSDAGNQYVKCKKLLCPNKTNDLSGYCPKHRKAV